MSQKNSHGGVRAGAGRKMRYGEPTTPIRVPNSQVGAVINILDAYKARLERGALPDETAIIQISPVKMETMPLTIPVASHNVPAGFPSPAEDYMEHGLDLNEHLILHKEATFILRVSGWSMLNAGIHDGDEIIVDRAIEPSDGHVVVAVIDNALTVKRLKKSGKTIRLVAENPDFPEIVLNSESELIIWGVVTRVLHRV